jgi:hypothetical protein
MHTTWSREGAALRIEFPVPLAARLFGLPFLLVGLYFAWTLVQAVLDVVRGDAPAGQLLVGVPLLLVMLALFGGPGVALVLFRKWVVIDQASGTLEEVKHFLVYTHRRRTPLSTWVTAWAVYRQPRDTSSRRAGKKYADYHVELTDAGGNHELVGLFDDTREAVQFGQHVAGLVGVPFEDHTGSDPQIDEDLAAEEDAERRA